MAAAVFCWGFGKYGQLGTGQNQNAEVPQTVKLQTGTTPIKISCGAHFTSLLCEVGSLKGTVKASTKIFTCGWGKYGRLGLGSEADKPLLSEVLFQDGVNDMLDVSAGHWHACSVARDGNMYSWGYNGSHGVLGGTFSEAVSTAAKPPPVFSPIPVRVNSPAGIRFKAVSCGYNFTFAISEEGMCFSWGCGKYGVLGHGDLSDRFHPSLLESIKEKKFRQIGCGYSHAALVETSGMLFTVGTGKDGALGHGRDKRDKNLPFQVEALLGLEISNASCSQGEHHAHTLACSSEGKVYSWGDGYKGKLGHGSQESCDTPTLIDPQHFLNERVILVSCGGIHSAALTDQGHMFTWGCGSDGRLGHPEAKGHRYLFKSEIPRIVEGFPQKSQKVADISCSYYHSGAVCCSSKT